MLQIVRALGSLALLVSLGAASLADEINWPEFRGPRGDGHSPNTGLPLTWGETENVRWKTAIHGKGWSSPVVWGKQVWLTTATEDGRQRFAVCIDADSGKIIHDVKVLDVPDPQYAHPTNSHASPTPAIEEGRVYLHFGSTGTMCLDTHSAKVLWQRTDLPCNHHRGAASSPILFENLLIVPFDGYDQQYVVAFDKLTGRTAWKRDRAITSYKSDDGDIKKAYGTCTVIDVAGKPQLIAPSAEATMAYDPRSGEELWRIRHGGMNVGTRPLFSQGQLIVSAGGGDLRLLAVDPDGHGDITDTHILWKHGKLVSNRPSPLLVGNLLFIVNNSGIGSCLDITTAKQQWQQRFGGDYSASPIFADGRIYFFSEDGRTPVVEPGAKFKQLAENKLGDGYMASPAVTGRAFILRSRSHLYRVEAP